ncbi:MAG: hypothetical protein J6D31_05575 [Clostridia bacterium]|nr:hypothetical protein [Clostridia bacterium]
MKKRVFSLLLACLMLLSACPILVVASDGEAAFTSSFYEDARTNIGVDWDADTVTYNGDWKVGIFTGKAGSSDLIISPLDKVTPFHDEGRPEGSAAGTKPDGHWACNQTSYNGVASKLWGIWNWSTLDGPGYFNLDTYAVGFGNSQVMPFYMYTVNEEGSFRLTAEIDKFEAPVEGKAFYMCVMVNEKMVWPTRGATVAFGAKGRDLFTDPDNVWYKVTETTTVEEINTALAELSVQVKTGDRVQFVYRHGSDTYSGMTATAMPKITATVDSGEADRFLIVREGEATLSSTLITEDVITLPAYTGDNCFIGWDLNGDGAADAAAGSKIFAADYKDTTITIYAVTVGASGWFENLPEVDEQGSPVFRGGWETGAYDKTTGQFLPFVAAPTTAGIITVNGNPWGKAGGGLYISGETAQIALSGCMPEENYLSEIRYTAPYAGELVYDLTHLVIERQDKGEAPELMGYSFALYVNDKKVWPADADMLAITNGEEVTVKGNYDALADIKAAGFPQTITVAPGDVISFRTQQDYSLTYMLHAYPTVQYTRFAEMPIVNSCDLTLGTDLSLNFYVSLLNPRENATVGLECWASEPTAEQLDAGGTKLEGTLDEASGFYRFTYKGLMAKQMTDLIYVRPCSTVGEEVVYGDVKALSIRDYAQAAIGQNEKLDAVLYALLSYGAGAQTLFGYKTGDLADANVGAENRVGEFSGELNNVYNNADGANKIKNVSLLLDSKLGFKFMIDSVEGAESYELEFSYNEDFSDSQKVSMEAVWEGREQKGSVHISLADLGKTFYVRVVVDGEAGATLTYSLDSYFARMQAKVDDNQYYTLSALVTLDRALSEYLA